MGHAATVMLAWATLVLASACGKGTGEKRITIPVSAVNAAEPKAEAGGRQPDPDETVQAKIAPASFAASHGYSDAENGVASSGQLFFESQVQGLLAQRCGHCHLGERFAFASLHRRGEKFTHAETLENYRSFVDLLSLDNPALSRLLAKILPDGHPQAMTHRAGPQVSGTADPLYQTLRTWAELEKNERCADCGVNAPRAWIAYVEQPEAFWMLERAPTRTDRDERRGARIMLQAVQPQTAQLVGEAHAFIGPEQFCGDGACDFGMLAANYAGTMLAFECRKSTAGESGNDVSWNICVAGVSPEGRAENPRFLLPASLLQRGQLHTRSDPFGSAEGLRSKGRYDKHFHTRQPRDATPRFTPDDAQIVFAGQREDARTGVVSAQTYHGDFVVDNLLAVSLDGGAASTIYRNEGGSADYPFYLRNGNIAFHTWNLDRMDRHMYVQALADGMMEMPVLGGRLQGPNMWGPAFQSNNGLIFGVTGRRRGELDNYAPFVFDHTLGISTTDETYREAGGFQLIPPGYIDEIDDYPRGFCKHGQGPEKATQAKNCSLSQLFLDPAYTPWGDALVAHSPERVYIGTGEDFLLNFGTGRGWSELRASVEPYLPKRIGISLFDRQGQAKRLIDNPAGTMLRYPAWVGARQHPRVQNKRRGSSSVLHIADVPLWLSFQEQGNRRGQKLALMKQLDSIVALRVLRKIGDGNGCLLDNRYVRMSNADSNGLHPSALGYVDSTGYERFVVPEELGGDSFGDIPLHKDRSVKVRIPAGELLLFQGVNRAGEVVSQHNRVFALPGGHAVDTSVKRSEYFAQCASCHGLVSSERDLAESRVTETQAPRLSYDTLAAASSAVELSTQRVATQELSYLAALRSLLSVKCASGCHSGELPAGGLSLAEQYSSTGNMPPADWAGDPTTRPAYLAFMRGRRVVRSPNFSVAYSWLFADDYPVYQKAYAVQIASDAPLGARAPWDPGYQNLFRQSKSGSFYYLNGTAPRTSFGRGYAVPGNSSRSFLIELLSGRDNDPGKDYHGHVDHRGMLTERQLRILQAVLDIGLPFMGRCGDKKIPREDLPNDGLGWGASLEQSE